jgi:ribonuclease P protein component
MLKKKFRLSSNKDIKAVLKRGRAIYTPILMFKYLPNQQRCSRFGLVVSNKVSKKATVRNLIKRRVRAQIGEALQNFKKSFDVVVLVSPKIINAKLKLASPIRLRDELNYAFKKIGLL